MSDNQRVRILIYNWSGATTPELYMVLRVINDDQWDEYQTTKMALPPTSETLPLVITSKPLPNDRLQSQLKVRVGARELVYQVTEEPSRIIRIYLVNNPKLSIPRSTTNASQYTYNAGWQQDSCYIVQGANAMPCLQYTFPPGSHVIPLNAVELSNLNVGYDSFPPVTECDPDSWSFWTWLFIIIGVVVLIIVLLFLGYAWGSSNR